MNAPVSSSAFAPGPVVARPVPNWSRALGGVWRLTYPGFLGLRRLIVLAGLLGLLGLLTLQTVRHGHSSAFYGWTAGFYLTFLLPSVAFLSAAGAIRDDMKSVTVDYVLTRPLRRPAFVVARYLCHMLCLQLASLLPLAVLYGIGRAEGVVDLGTVMPQVCVGQGLIVAGFSALGLLAGAMTPRYIVLGLTYGFFVELGVGQIPTQINRLSITHHVLGYLNPVLPDVRGWHAAEGFWTAGGAIGMFVLAGVAGAAVLLAWREFTGSGAVEK